MKFSLKQIGYLAGLIDGEGSIYFSVTTYRAKDGNRAYKTWVSVITNTNQTIILHVLNLLKEAGYDAKLRSQRPKGRAKKGYTVFITRMEQQYRFLKLLSSSLVAKSEQCELMLKFLKPRINRKKGNGLRLNDTERLCVSRVKFLNHRGTFESVTTVRETPGDGMKIQSELHSDMQSPAEMPGLTLVKAA